MKASVLEFPTRLSFEVDLHNFTPEELTRLWTALGDMLGFNAIILSNETMATAINDHMAAIGDLR